MLYAAKCYWPGVTTADLEQVAGRAASTGLDAGTGPVATSARCCSPTTTRCCAMGRTCARPGWLRWRSFPMSLINTMMLSLVVLS